MGKVGGGGLVLAGILVIIFGFLIRSGLIEWLLDIVGIVIIVTGAVIGLIGLIKVFSGGGESTSSDF